MPESGPVDNLLSCHTCQLTLEVTGPIPHKHHICCPRCGTTVHRRIPGSLQKTAALVIAGFILFIPANLLPVMTVTMMGSTKPDTIFDGVVQLFQGGMWGIGLLLFTASIVVPLMKLVGLAFLVISVYLKWTWNPYERTRLYAVISFIGRWSMLDVFTLSLLAGLVQLGHLATIVPGEGAFAFAAVVVITLFASKTFDPRLIWDVNNPSQSTSEKTHHA